MIISVSRRTGIPALFSEWFYTRVKRGYVLLRNPYTPMQVGLVTLTPDRVDGFVFWTKNAVPMLSHIHELNQFEYYFQHTITPYGRDVEPNVPDKHEIVISAFNKIGADKAVWRYDPIFLNERYTWAYHIQALTKIAEMVEGHTHKVVLSFVDNYRGIDLSSLHILPLTPDQQLAEIAADHGIELSACAEDLGIAQSCCVDGRMFDVVRPKDRNQRGLCGCMESVDIGSYSTYSSRCVYCYANQYGRVQCLPDPNCDLLGPPFLRIIAR